MNYPYGVHIAVVCVDYYGFNRQVLALARRHGVPAFYFISPQVWAWNPGRIRQMAQLLDLMLCILPFEAKLYNKSGLRTVFVGHPMIEDLAKIPHVLIAGTTGSGKSVCINSIIMTMLLTQRPDHVKLIMVDPKMVEMQDYKSIPLLNQ